MPRSSIGPSVEAALARLIAASGVAAAVDCLIACDPSPLRDSLVDRLINESTFREELARDRPSVPVLQHAVALSSAMHQEGSAFVPLLMLKEFDQYTTTHALNVAVLAMGLAEHLRLSAREVRAYSIAGLLHDLGKVKVPVEIVQKPGALTPEEREVMCQHPVDGARMILDSDNRLDLSAAVAFEHHIMIDGGGYPARRSRRECHHASMLVHVCDVFDALRTHRPYRVAWETNAIVDYITQRIGTEFHTDIARAFVTMLRDRDVRQARADAIDGIELVFAAGT